MQERTVFSEEDLVNPQNIKSGLEVFPPAPI